MIPGPPTQEDLPSIIFKLANDIPYLEHPICYLLLLPPRIVHGAAVSSSFAYVESRAESA